MIKYTKIKEIFKRKKCKDNERMIKEKVLVIYLIPVPAGIFKLNHSYD